MSPKRLTLALALAFTAATTHAAENCTAPVSTLLFDCEKYCDKRLMPCMRASTAAKSCAIECFPLALQTDKQLKVSSLTFLVPFGNTSVLPPNTPTVNASANSTTNGSRTDATITFASVFAMKSNDAVQTIEQVLAPRNVTVVTFRGGASPNETIKGQVANVAFKPDLLSKSRQILSLSLDNFNLTTAVDALLDGLIKTSKLDTLSFSNGLLTAFPDKVLKLKTLRKLYLGFNTIARVDEALTKTSALQILDLTANKVTEMPSAKTFPKLKSLLLAKNALKSVPKASERTGLLELALHENQISAYDATNRDLIFLDLGSNLLTAVPPTIHAHKKLKILRLSNNKIPSIPTNLSLTALESLEIVGNELTTYDVKLPGLKKLDLSGNKLTTIPAEIFKLTKLQHLLLANNSFSNGSIAFTQAQATFMKQLQTFAINLPLLKKDCDEAHQQRMSNLNMTFCITDGLADKSTPKPTPTPKATPKLKKHKRHESHKSHKHKHKHDDDDAAPPTIAPSDAPTPVAKSDEVTTQFAAVDAQSRSDATLVIALSSAAGGVVAALGIAMIVVVTKQRNTKRVISTSDGKDAAAADVAADASVERVAVMLVDAADACANRDDDDAHTVSV